MSSVVRDRPAAEAEGGGGQDAWPAPRVAWTTVFVLVLLGIVSMLDRQIINLLAPSIKTDLGLSDLQLSLLQGISFAIFYATLGIPLGYAADRFPRRLVIFGGIFIWSSAATLSGLAQSYGHLLLARIFIGMGEAALAPCAYSMITDLFPPKRLGRALSVYSYSSSIGSAVALAAGGALVTMADTLRLIDLFAGMETWQIGFIVTGAPGLVLAFAVFALPEPIRRGSRRTQDIGSWRDVLRFLSAHRGFFGGHLVGFSTLMVITYGLSAWLPVLLMRSFGWEAGQVGLVYALFILCNSLLALTAHGLIVDRLFARGITDAHLRYFMMGCPIIVVFGLLAVNAGDAYLYLALIAPAFWMLNTVGVAATAVQLATPGQMRGRVSAIYLMVVNLLGLGAGPFVVAMFTNLVFRDETRLNWSIAATMVILAPVAMLAFSSGLKPMRRAIAEAQRTTPAR